VQEGVETIVALRRENPDLPIIAISGGLTSSAVYLEIAGEIGANRILHKPFTPAQLLQTIADVFPGAAADTRRQGDPGRQAGPGD
jgi:CheY-like chemotaxis protein